MSAATAAAPLIDRAAPIAPAAYFELLRNITRREVKGRYSQTLFGVGWAIAQPLATMAVFTLVFSRLANILSDVPYPVFAYAGLVPWFFFLNSVNSGTMSLVQYRNIVTKTYFPREIIPLSQVCSRLLDFGAAAALFAVLMAYYRVGMTLWILLVPALFALLLLACLPIYSWITSPDKLALVANYSPWLIAAGAWGLFMYEIREGGLLVRSGRPSVLPA